MATTFSALASSPLHAMLLDATKNSSRNMIFEVAWEISEREMHFWVWLRGHDTPYQTVGVEQSKETWVEQRHKRLLIR